MSPMEYAIIAGIGVLFGIAALPWHKKISNEPIMYWLMMASGMWIVLIVALAWMAFTLFRDGWSKYALERHTERMRSKQ